MKHKKFLLLFFVIVLTWFSSNIEGAFASTYPSSVAWNNYLYGLSVEEVDSKDIGNEIGKIKRQRTPMPKKNGESNEKHHVGSSLFEIKGVDIKDAIAVKVDEKFFKASQIGPLQELSNVKPWAATLSVVGLLVLLTAMAIWRKRRSIG
ncbi:hypothetical protein [Paenibacillus montanisoli]|uniref:Gram-positive cocci surface proteins LPxTG domain-containing protein n=1 Tax=Paenibacillus montanisoli TaxID=2081970 RepID=A0A328UB22_9BACL|nr:hypothetical protein [Paenibacillus montanisoli]RAP77246.1 hypothetical protein DL346_01720 [Paenibacillus montanisoli]